jgi:hypothetical protein
MTSRRHSSRTHPNKRRHSSEIEQGQVSIEPIASKFEDELARMRTTDLAFFPDHIEPAAAVRWIEAGGHRS